MRSKRKREWKIARQIERSRTDNLNTVTTFFTLLSSFPPPTVCSRLRDSGESTIGNRYAIVRQRSTSERNRSYLRPANGKSVGFFRETCVRSPICSSKRWASLIATDNPARFPNISLYLIAEERRSWTLTRGFRDFQTLLRPGRSGFRTRELPGGSPSRVRVSFSPGLFIRTFQIRDHDKVEKRSEKRVSNVPAGDYSEKVGRVARSSLAWISGEGDVGSHRVEIPS